MTPLVLLLLGCPPKVAPGPAASQTAKEPVRMLVERDAADALDVATAEIAVLQAVLGVVGGRHGGGGYRTGLGSTRNRRSRGASAPSASPRAARISSAPSRSTRSSMGEGIHGRRT